MQVKAFSFLCLTIPLASVPCHATEFQIATEPWESYSTEDGVGYYHDILNAIYKTTGDSLKFTYAPYVRSLHMLATDKVDIALGVTKDDAPEGSVNLDLPVEMDSAAIAYLQGSFPDWQGVASLEGHSVIAKINYGFGGVLGPKVKYSESASLPGMLQMLVNKRVDAVIDYEADIQSAAEEAKITQPLVIKTGFNPVPIFFGFSKTDNGKLAREKFDAGLKKLVESGALKEMYLKHIGKTDNFPYQK